MIFELTIPGRWLVMEDRRASWEITNFIDHIKGAFFSANISLCDFNNSETMSRAMHDKSDRLAMREERRRRSSEMYEKRSVQLGRLGGKRASELMDEIDLDIRREDWARGIEPDVFTHKRSFIYAKSFVYSLDDFSNFLKIFSSMDQVPSSISLIYKELLEKFPALRGVRNAAHHPEDRMRGIKFEKGREVLIDIKEIDNGILRSPAGSGNIINENLFGTQFAVLTTDGTQGSIDISPSTLAYFRDIFHLIVNEFKWKGGPIVEPR
ncbi:hypothetical protein [Burkholderia gladioli]|uniref:hypothetical protein n=1 Tax=Burkholderia gladioli TaxID=28095 RepID=UPI0016413DBA|nr:hypothetical protein [Burkholderia gladioli]